MTAPENSPVGFRRSVYVASTYGYPYPASPSGAEPTQPASAPFTGGLTRRVTASLGLTTTVDPATAPEELVQEADRHMYEVKRRHKTAP